jgi:predicted NBD/HSP70 family sugar kinase
MFRRKDILSIAEIADRIKLSKTSVTKVVNDFGKKGLVVAAGKGNSTDVGGKKPELFAFNAAYSCVIALTIGIDFITGAVMDLKCSFINHRSVKCAANTSYKTAVRNMAGMIHRLIRDSGLKIDVLNPIVIGCEGVIDAYNGIIRYTIHHKWGQNLPLREDLVRALGFPVNIYVDNNFRLAGYIDTIGNGDTYDSQAVIITSNSAGGTILENQQLIHGSSGFVGEFGHIIVEPDSDIKCDCGGYGCFGILVSPGILLARAAKLCGTYPESLMYSKTREGTLTIADIFAASNQNDPFACALMDQVIRYFAIVIHNIVLLRDPERVIIQGIYAAAGEYFLKKLQEKVNTLPYYKMKRNLPIIYSSVSGINPALIGAGYYAVDLLLDTNSLYD